MVLRFDCRSKIWGSIPPYLCLKPKALGVNPTNKVQKEMAKSLLNNLLGRFGISLDKPRTEILSDKAFNEKALISKITSYNYISKDKVLVSYVARLNEEIIRRRR